jgi:hypothetical protein
VIGCTRLSSVSGIHRTHRGRRGSGLGRLLAGTAFASPVLCGRDPGSSTPRFRLRRPPPPWLISSLHRARLCGSTPRCVAPRPCGSSPRRDASRPCGSTLAGVGHRPLAIGHGCLAGLRAGVPDRRPVSPLSSSPACSGAGSGWHCRARIADCTVHLGGPATLGAGPLMCADSWAVTLWRIASAARLRRSRGHRAERGQPVPSARHHCGCSLGQVGVRSGPGPTRARPCAAAAQP